MWAAKYSYIYITGEVRADDGSSTSNVGWNNYKRVEVAVDGCIHIYADGNFKCSIKDFGNESGSFSNWNDFNGSNKEYLVCFGENWGTTDFGNNGNYGDNTVGNNHYVKLKPRDDGKFDLTKQTTSTLPIVKVIGFVNESSTSWDSNGVEISLDEGCKTASGSFTLYNGENFRIKIGDTEYGPAKDGTSITLGEAANYTASSNAWQLAKGKKYNIIVDNQAITVTQNIVDVYLVGDVTGGWNTSDDWKFDTTDGVTYTLTGKNMTSKKNFKLLTSAGAWYGNGDTDISVPYNKALTTSGGNMQLSSDANNVNITFNLSTGAFSIESAVTYDTYKLNIGGNEVTMSTSDGATYTASSTLSAGKTISLVNSTSGTTLYPSESATYKGGEVTYTMTGAAGNAITTDNVNNASFSGNYSFTYTVADNTLVVNGAVATYTYDKYYVKYTTNNWSSGSYGSHEMTRQDDGTYTYTLTNPTTAWELAMQKNGTAGDNDFWTDAENNTYTGGTMDFSMKNHDKNQSKNIKFGEGLRGDYLLTYNPTTETLTISGGSTPTPSVSYRLKYTEDNWKNSKYSKPLTDNGNGSFGYTFTNPVEGLQFMVQRSTDNGKSYLDFCWPDANDKKYTGGEKTFTMSGGFGNNVTFGAGLSGEYTLTFTPNTTDPKQSTLTISGNSVAGFDDVYLRGSSPLSWTKSEEAYMFTTSDGKIYTLKGVNLGKDVKMKVIKKETMYGYDNATVVGPAVRDNDTGVNDVIKLTEDLVNATITFDITVAATPVITIVNPKSAYLRGDFTDPNWTDKDEYKFSTTDNQTYVLEHVNIANGKLMKVYYGGTWYGHDANKVTGPVSAENDGQGGYNMKLTEELKDATITFTISSTNAENWTITIVNGGAVEHKAYYFAGDMNRWYSKKFDGDETASGIDPDIFAAEKDKWQFEYVGKVVGQTEKGWYKYVFDKDKVGMSTLVGQFQIIDDSGWSGSQYSNNPKVENYSDASGFARYNCRPITREMINERTVLTKETSEGMPGIIQQAGSNFHLDCNGVNNAVIYFLPGENPKMFITGDPTDYFIFYSASGKTGGDNAVSIKIVNGKPNTTNYYLPGVEGLKNYTTEDAKSTAPHMNIEAVTPTLIDFSDPAFVNDGNYIKVFGNSGYVGDLTKEDFQKKIINNSQLPNGISLTGRGQVYVAKVPNGFEYAAGRKFAVTFAKAFSQSEKETSSSIVANHLYFFNDNLHVLLNVDNYEAEAANPENNADVKLYYRVYGYDSEYNTIVVKSDGTTETLYAKNVVIGLTEKGNDTQKNAGWVEYNNYKVPSLTSYTGSDKWHYVTDANNDFLGIDPKYGNFFVQFKIVTGPKKSQATNGPAKAVDKEYTLYLPEKTLALNQEGFYNFNGQDIYQKFDGGYTTTGVEDVFEDQIVEEGVDAEPIFFNLQGQRVVNPEKGMYIVVKGNKTYKVMIK